MTAPVAGAHYPRSTGEFLSWFGTDDDCLDYLEWLRWPGGFVCRDCGHAGGWRLGDGRVKCGGCGSRTSVTAGTIFDKTRTPLTVWFHACWLFATAKDGISAQHLQRVLEISSYQTAWAMLHRLRSALVRPGRDRLSGTVEVDETYIGGEEPGLRGGRQRGKKVLTGIAVEVREPKGIGRCRMAPLDDASGDTLGTFVTENVQPGATVITDGWAAYRAISGKGYQHRPINQKAARAAGEDPDSLLPGVHRVASLCKRWLLGTHQGSVDAAHLPAYLNEFVFRFNRRRSASRGMVFYRVLQLAAGHEPVRYVDLLASKKPRRAKRAEGGTGHPPSLERPAADRPWRTAGIQLQFPVRLSGYPGAVYPEEAINGHRAFIARRRELRPSEEYRAPTDEEWEEFLGHFERRKLALGDCGRAYGSSCIHEHSCVRCPLLRVGPAQRPRLEEIRDNLTARISEAKREGWTGESEGLQVSLAAANNKLAQVDGLIARRRSAVSLDMPSFPDIAGRTAAPAKEPA